MQQAEKEGKVDVVKQTTSMRQERVKMIQTQVNNMRIVQSKHTCSNVCRYVMLYSIDIFCHAI